MMEKMMQEMTVHREKEEGASGGQRSTGTEMANASDLVPWTIVVLETVKKRGLLNRRPFRQRSSSRGISRNTSESRWQKSAELNAKKSSEDGTTKRALHVAERRRLCWNSHCPALLCEHQLVWAEQ